jgi:hypothetical protein
VCGLHRAAGHQGAIDVTAVDPGKLEGEQLQPSPGDLGDLVVGCLA